MNLAVQDAGEFITKCDVAACDKICDLVKLLVSAAKSASSIRDLAASVFTFKVVRLLIVASRRFS